MESDSYFSDYAQIDVHRRMLSDKPRTEAYKKAILQNPTLFQGKTILDVGTGTGILAMFAAKAGATRVFAVEGSNIYKLTEKIIQQNGFESVVTVIHGQMEDVVLPQKVDIIISEWMGHFLLHESMFRTVIFARDRWLKEGGTMFPTYCNLYLAPVHLPHIHTERIDFWSGNLYNFDFSPVQNHARQALSSSSRIEQIKPNCLLCSGQNVCTIDMNSVGIDDLDKIDKSMNFLIEKDAFIDGVAFWFDVSFEADTFVVLDTSPQSPETHWRQTIIMLPKRIEVARDDIKKCDLMMIRSDRTYDVAINFSDVSGIKGLLMKEYLNQMTQPNAVDLM